jgi:hypothetical protein
MRKPETRPDQNRAEIEGQEKNFEAAKLENKQATAGDRRAEKPRRTDRCPNPSRDKPERGALDVGNLSGKDKVWALRIEGEASLCQTKRPVGKSVPDKKTSGKIQSGTGIETWIRKREELARAKKRAPTSVCFGS